MTPEKLEDRRLMAGDWRNPVLPEDVNTNGFIGVEDLAGVVVALRERGNPHNLTIPPQAPFVPPPYVDVNGDDVAAVNDLLLIVTQIRDGIPLNPPVFQAGLMNDTPPDTMDGVTSDATIAGQITANLHAGTHVLARLDGGPWTNLPLGNNGSFTYSPALAGDGSQNGMHQVLLIAQTWGGAPVPQTISFEFVAGDGVSLQPIEPLSVVAGRTVETPLVASSPNGPVTFMLASETPLPKGRLRADGVLEFTPSADDVGAYQFEIVASDGEGETRRTVALEVTPDPIGTTRLSGKVLDTQSQPIVGLRVSLGAMSVLTGASGEFSIDAGSAGPFIGDTLRFHGNELAGDKAYPFVAEKLELMFGHEVFLGVLNEIRRPVYLPVLDVAGGTQINPAQDTTVSQEVAPGETAEVFVEAGTLFNQQGSPFQGVLSITEVPPDLTPAALPNNLSPSLVVTIQPGEMTFATPAPVAFPNRDGWAPFVPMDLWSINPVTGEFDDVGDGFVTPDGSRVVTTSGGIRNSSWHFFVPRIPRITIDDDDCGCDDCEKQGASNSAVSFGTGAITESHALPVYSSLGQWRGVSLVYDSLRADPRRIFHGSADNVPEGVFGDPGATRIIASASVNVNGVDVAAPGFAQPGQFGLLGGENFFDVPAGNGRLDAALMIDLSSQPTGVYPYQVTAGVYGFMDDRFNGSSQRVNGMLVHVNGMQSPFGAGWGLAGLQSLMEGPDGIVAIIDGDGQNLQFTPSTEAGFGQYGAPPGDFSKLEKLGDGSFRRTLPDKMVYEFNAQGRLTVERDRNGNETHYQYDAAGNLTKIIDPVGLETTLAYANGKVTSMTDPIIRVTQLHYDAAGNLTRLVNPDGSERRFEYDARHHLTAEVNERGFRETNEYDAFGRATRADRPDGSSVEMTPLAVRGLYASSQSSNPMNPPAAVRTLGESVYVSDSGNTIRTQLDVEGQLMAERDSIGPVGFVQRDFRNLVALSVNARGNVTQYGHDDRGNITSIRDEIGGFGGTEAESEIGDGALHYEYDFDFSQLTRRVDELGREILFTIDPMNGNTLTRTEVIGAAGGGDDLVTQYTYTAHGQMDTMTDALGRVTDYDYDALGRLVSITFALGTAEEATQSYEYDAAGNLAASIDELGNRTEFEYDTLNRLRRVTEADPDGAGPLTSPVTQYFHDAAGNVVRAIDARGNELLYTYDSRNRLVTATDPNAGVTRYEYDLAGNVTKMIDPLGHETQYVYDARNRLLETHDADGGVTRRAYDLDDNLVQVTDPKGNVTEFEYDARNRMFREIQLSPEPGGGMSEVSRTFIFDTVDNLLSLHDRNGRVINYAYDDVDRIVSESWSGGVNEVQHTYDAVGNLLSVTDQFSTLTFTYDSRNRVKTIDNAGTPDTPNVVLTYSYDDANNVLSVADAISGVAAGMSQYAYDALNRMTRISQNGTGVTDKRVDFKYNPLGQFATIDRFVDLAGAQPVVQSVYSYDALNRLTSLQHQDGGNNVAFYNFTFDAASRVTQIETIDGATTYTYDDRNQLNGANHADIANPDETYVYDASGNRVSSHLHGGGYVVDAHNRLTSDGTYLYAYDAEGNLVMRTEIGTGAEREFHWDHRNRLSTIIDTDGADVQQQRIDFTYDALNRRKSRTWTDGVDQDIAHFVYDRANVLLDFVDDDGAGPGAAQLSQRYLHGPAVDQVLAQDDGAGEVLWMLADHLGTVRDLADDDGSILNHLKYDSYGNLIDQSNAAFATRYGFAGREFDRDANLYYFRSRFYDASLGRFINEDPIGLRNGESSLYVYAGSSPISAVDPLGTCRIEIFFQKLDRPTGLSNTLNKVSNLFGQGNQFPTTIYHTHVVFSDTHGQSTAEGVPTGFPSLKGKLELGVYPFNPKQQSDLRHPNAPHSVVFDSGNDCPCDKYKDAIDKLVKQLSGKYDYSPMGRGNTRTSNNVPAEVVQELQKQFPNDKFTLPPVPNGGDAPGYGQRIQR